MYFLKVTKRIIEEKGAVVATIKYQRMKMQNIRAPQPVESLPIVSHARANLICALAALQKNTDFSK